jgi:outer membrane autotransporter protein
LMKRSFYRVLLASVSASAILVAWGAARADVLTNSGTITDGVTLLDGRTPAVPNGFSSSVGAIISNGNAYTEIYNSSAGAISNSGGSTAIDTTSNTWEVYIINSGRIVGDIKLGVPTNSDDPNHLGDHIVFLNAGSTLTGNIISAQADTGNVNIGATGVGVATIGGDIGSSSAPIHNFTIYNGATIAFSQDSQIHTSGFNVVNGGTVDLGTSKVTFNYYPNYTGTENLSGDIFYKTTINTSTGKHGMWVFTQGGGTPDTTMFSDHAGTIVPTVVGSAATGATYVIIQDTNGRTVMNLPSVVNSGGYRWTVTSVTGAGETDTDGVSYGTGYSNIVLTNAGSNAAATATGTNGKAVSALASYSGTNTAMQSLSSAVNNLTSDTEIQKAGAQLRPEVNGGTTQASLGAVNQALGTIQVRTDSVRMASADQTGISSGESLKGVGVWGQGFGSTASQDRRQDVDGYTSNTYGLAFGADAQLLDPVRVGVSFAYARTLVDDSGSRDGSGQKINSYIGSLYGTYTAKRWYMDGALTYGQHEYDSTRLVNFTGATAQTAKASFSGQQYGAKTEFGYPVSVGKTVVTPLASLAYNHLNQDGYSETGATGANLTVTGSSTDSIRSGLGGKVSTTVAQAGEWNIKPNARAMWQHEFNASAPDQTSTFVAGGSAFTTSGIQVAQEHFNLGIGLDVASVRNTTVSAKYDVDLSDRYVSHTGSMQVRTEF